MTILPLCMTLRIWTYRPCNKTIELAAMVLSSIPMIIAYPFAQKFFVKGVLLGLVKE